MSVENFLRSGEAAARAGARAQARSHFRAALALAPGNAPAMLWLAWLDDDPRASLAYVTRAQELAPGDPRVQAARRWVERRQNAVSDDGPDPEQAPVGRRLALKRIGVFSILGLLILLLTLSLTVSWPRDPAVSIAMALTDTPSATATSSPVSVVSTETPTLIPTVTRTSTPSPLPTYTPSPTPSLTPSPTLSSTPHSGMTLPTAPSLPPSLTPAPASVASSGVRWIDVDLTHQLLSAYEDQKLVRITSISTGLPNTPTPAGQFHVWIKLRADTMSGPGYHLPNVPYVMYFHGGYGIHGTYWHANFGQPMSHGCVNLPTEEAEWLYNWAEVGDLVNIHH